MQMTLFISDRQALLRLPALFLLQELEARQGPARDLVGERRLVRLIQKIPHFQLAVQATEEDHARAGRAPAAAGEIGRRVAGLEQVLLNTFPPQEERPIRYPQQDVTEDRGLLQTQHGSERLGHRAHPLDHFRLSVLLALGSPVTENQLTLLRGRPEAGVHPLLLLLLLPALLLLLRGFRRRRSVQQLTASHLRAAVLALQLHLVQRLEGHIAFGEVVDGGLDVPDQHLPVPRRGNQELHRPIVRIPLSSAPLSLRDLQFGREPLERHHRPLVRVINRRQHALSDLRLVVALPVVVRLGAAAGVLLPD
mmetsp:Transcript_28007/g.67275  ORF Transcript_28007/g.67275 Transcript_28007/m.67275 type:complete len:308 (+) Transcript_28007:340-1263(+)